MTDDAKQEEETVEQKPKISKKETTPKTTEASVVSQEIPDDLYQTLKAIWEPKKPRRITYRGKTYMFRQDSGEVRFKEVIAGNDYENTSV